MLQITFQVNPNDYEPLNPSEATRNSKMLPFTETFTSETITTSKLNCTFCGPSIKKPFHELIEDHMGVVNCEKLWKSSGRRQSGTPGVTCFLCNKAKTKQYSNTFDLDKSHANIDKCFQITFIRKHLGDHYKTKQEDIQSIVQTDHVSAKQSLSSFDIYNVTNGTDKHNKVNTDFFLKGKKDSLKTLEQSKTSNSVLSLSNIKAEEKETPLKYFTKANVIQKNTFRAKQDSIKNYRLHSKPNDSVSSTKTSSNEISQYANADRKGSSSFLSVTKHPKQNIHNFNKDGCTVNTSQIIYFDSVKNKQTIPLNTNDPISQNSLRSLSNIKQISETNIQNKNSDRRMTKQNMVSMVPVSGVESLEQSQPISNVSYLDKINDTKKKVIIPKIDSELKTNLSSDTNPLPAPSQLHKNDQTNQDLENEYQMKTMKPELHCPGPSFVEAEIEDSNKMETTQLKSSVNSCLVKVMNAEQPSQLLGSYVTPKLKAKVSKAGPKKRTKKSETQKVESIIVVKKEEAISNQGSKLTVVETDHLPREAASKFHQESFVQSKSNAEVNQSGPNQSKIETDTAAGPKRDKLLVRVPKMYDVGYKADQYQSSTEHESLKTITKSDKNLIAKVSKILAKPSESQLHKKRFPKMLCSGKGPFINVVTLKSPF